MLGYSVLGLKINYFERNSLLLLLLTWGKTAKLHQTSLGHSPTWAGVLGPCAAALRFCGGSLQVHAPWKERKGVCNAQRAGCGPERWGWLCLWRQSCIPVPLPISAEFHFQQCSDWWWNMIQALSFYSITELIQFTSPKNQHSYCGNICGSNLPRLSCQNKYFQNLTARLVNVVKFIASHF